MWTTLRKQKKLLPLLSGTVLSCLNVVTLTCTNIYARVSNAAQQKADAYAAYQCFKDGALSSNTITVGGGYGWGGVATIVDKQTSVPKTTDSNGNPVAAGSTQYCKDLIKNNYGSKVPTRNDYDTLDKFLTDMGYEKTIKSTGSGERCAELSFSNKESGSSKSTKICASGASSNSQNIGKDTKITFDGNDRTFNGIDEVGFSAGNGKIQITGLHFSKSISTSGKTFDQLMTEISGVLNSEQRTDKGTFSGTNWSYTGASNSQDHGAAGTVAEYKYNTDNADKTLKYLTGYNSVIDTRLDSNEKASVMKSILNDYYGMQFYNDDESCNLSATDLAAAKSSSDYKPINWNGKVCYVAMTRNQGGKVAGLSGDYFAGSKNDTNTRAMSFESALNRAGAISAGTDGSVTGDDSDSSNTKPDGSVGGSLTDTDGDGDPENPTSESTPECYKAGQALGWIICPVIQGVGTAVESLYETILVPFIQVRSSMVEQGGPLYGAWNAFRQVANIVFAIAFVFVILAQITGFGMSNYNIKKIFPRLLMVVILVNVSFLLIQIAVDLSNILGSGIQNMFTNMAAEANSAGEDSYTVGGIAKSLIATLFTVGAAGAAGAAAAVTWDLWLFPFLLALLSAFIGLIFFFFILAVREAAVVVLIAVAPAAIVCYALPNTKGVFDRWFSLFKAVILVYPICGALIGGGKFASALLISVGNNDDRGFIYMLVAMLISVVPFFLVPTIVKSSLKAVGGIGAKLSGVGKNLSKWTSKQARSSEAGRDFQRSISQIGDRQRLMRLRRKYNLEEGGSLANVPARVAKRDQKLASRLNAQTTEDLAYAGTTATALIRGNPELEARVVSQTEAEGLDKEVKAQQFAYQTGGVIMSGHESDPNTDDYKINYNDASSLGNEYQALLRTLDSNPQDRQAKVRLRAVTNRLMQMKENGEEQIRAGIQAVYGSRLADIGQNGINAKDNSGQYEYGGLREAVAHLSSEHVGNIKGMDRGFHDFIQEASTGAAMMQTDAATGNVVNKLQNNNLSQFDSDAAGKYSENALANANDEALKRYLQAMRNNTMSESSRRQLSRTAAAVLDNPNANDIKPATRKTLESIAAVGYGDGAEARTRTNATTATEASGRVATIGARAVNNIADQIADSDLSQSTTDDGNNNLRVEEIRDFAENSRRALESADNLDQNMVNAHQRVLAAAKAKGVKARDGGDFSPVERSDIKIFHNQSQPQLSGSQPQPASTRQPLPLPPSGYDRQGNWTARRRETTQDRHAYESWKRQADATQQANEQQQIRNQQTDSGIILPHSPGNGPRRRS